MNSLNQKLSFRHHVVSQPGKVLATRSPSPSSGSLPIRALATPRWVPRTVPAVQTRPISKAT
jgi:hypothetical protein